MINGGLVLPDGPDLHRLSQAPPRLAGAGLFTVPNLITLARLCAVPAAGQLNLLSSPWCSNCSIWSIIPFDSWCMLLRPWIS